jgi:peptidoglycan/xylan/chitin deacetylase (PgdA/CDA1 family)
VTLQRRAKRALFGLIRTGGGFDLYARSRWRRRRLVVLCYHGFSTDEEHLWRPGLFMRESVFRQRLEQLRRRGASVLPLEDALRRLAADELPPCAVCLTTDDGFSDFRTIAHPALAEAGMPMTLYWTTWYAGTGVPVFNLMVSYLLWKGRGRRIQLPGAPGSDAGVALDSEAAREAAAARTWQLARSLRWDLEQRQAILRELSGRVHVDYDRLLERRALQIMSPEEIRALDRGTVSVQLHSHRHRMPRDPGALARELDDNRAAIIRALGAEAPPVHFCYPSGEFHADSPARLAALGIRSAVTCEPGLADRETQPLLLPRYLDGDQVSGVEFDGWVSGLTGWLAGRGVGRRRAVES